MPFRNLFEKGRAKKYFVPLLAVWTVLVLASVGWNLYANSRDTIGKARVEARTILEHNLAYRRWNSMQGGVYAQLSEHNQPNPYLPVEFRDIQSGTGMALTLINPFRMTKQAYQLLRERSPSLAAVTRTVSLKPVNPDNAPDDWEREALHAFEKGVAEVSEITEIDQQPYLRLLAPYITEEECLKCHGRQGYKVGDIRGGMSIAVPMQPYYQIAASTRNSIIVTHILLWLLGAGALALFTRGINKYEGAIAESEEKFRIVSEYAHHFEWWINEYNDIVFISPSCKRITGYSREEFMARPPLLLEIIHPDDRELFKCHVANTEEGPQEDKTFRIITKDGHIRWLAHTCSPIYIDGKYLGRRGSNRDITDKKQLEEQLLQAKKMECLGRFAGGVAHDFNNILSSITTFTHLVEDELEEKKNHLEEYFNHILVAAKLGRNMTSNLLAFGRRQITRPERLSLNEVVRNVSDITKALLHEDIDYQVRLSREEAQVLADPHQVEQLLLNLCINARDAMYEGGTLRIETRRVELTEPRHSRFGDIPAGLYMGLTVSDTGFGIPPKNLPHIFEPFFSTKDRCKGTGLGLAIVNNIIQENGAFIEVESDLGQGTSFQIFFSAVKDS